MSRELVGLVTEIESALSKLFDKVKNGNGDQSNAQQQIATLTQESSRKDQTIADLMAQLAASKLETAQAMGEGRALQGDIEAAHTEYDRLQTQANQYKQNAEQSAQEALSLKQALDGSQQELTSSRQDTEQAAAKLAAILSQFKDSLGGDSTPSSAPVDSTPTPAATEEPSAPPLLPTTESGAAVIEPTALPAASTSDPASELPNLNRSTIQGQDPIPGQPVAPVAGEPQLDPLVPGVDPMADSSTFVVKPSADQPVNESGVIEGSPVVNPDNTPLPAIEPAAPGTPAEVGVSDPSPATATTVEADAPSNSAPLDTANEVPAPGPAVPADGVSEAGGSPVIPPPVVPTPEESAQ